MSNIDLVNERWLFAGRLKGEAHHFRSASVTVTPKGES
jgi:hypothetical protein